MKDNRYPRYSQIPGFEGELPDGSSKSKIVYFKNKTCNLNIVVPDTYVSFENLKKTINRYKLIVTNNSFSFRTKPNNDGIYFFMEIESYNNTKNPDYKYAQKNDYYSLTKRLVTPNNFQKSLTSLLEIVNNLAPEYYKEHNKY